VLAKLARAVKTYIYLSTLHALRFSNVQICHDRLGAHNDVDDVVTTGRESRAVNVDAA